MFYTVIPVVYLDPDTSIILHSMLEFSVESPLPLFSSLVVTIRLALRSL